MRESITGVSEYRRKQHNVRKKRGGAIDYLFVRRFAYLVGAVPNQPRSLIQQLRVHSHLPLTPAATFDSPGTRRVRKGRMGGLVSLSIGYPAQFPAKCSLLRRSSRACIMEIKGGRVKRDAHAYRMISGQDWAVL